MATQPSRNGRPATKTPLKVLDPKVIDSMTWARHDGGKGKGPPRCCNAQDDGEDERRRLADLRARLLAFIGDENSLDLLLGREAGTISDVQLGRAWCGIHRITARRRIERFLRRRKQEWIARIAQVGHDLLRRTGGATIEPWTAQPLLPVEGWFVSLGNLELRYPGLAPASVIAGYVHQYAPRMFGEQGLYLGLWRDPHSLETHHNLTKIYRDQAAALAAAHATGQKTITNAETLETLWLDCGDERRTAA